MSPLIVCECGTIVRGDDERELLSAAHGHMRSNHPAIAAQITDEQLLALSQEEPPLLDPER
jgi:predicted small metal-binding protein